MLSKCKIYNDGSHWISILPVKNPNAFKLLKPEDVYNVYSDGSFEVDQQDLNKEILRKTTRSEEFKALYTETVTSNIVDVKGHILEHIKGMFEDEEKASAYVDYKLANKRRAQYARSLRFKRKACLNKFSYFATFTYDDTKCSFESFDRQIRLFFNNMSSRHGWKVMMVPEFGKENNRYHFHAVIYIPKGSSIPGSFHIVKRYNKKKRRMVEINENTYFAERWGHNDWQSLMSMSYFEQKNTISYIIKYLTKSDNYAFYSRGIKTYLLSYIDQSDIFMPLENYRPQRLMYDNFHFYNDDLKDLGPFQPSFVFLFGFC